MELAQGVEVSEVVAEEGKGNDVRILRVELHENCMEVILQIIAVEAVKRKITLQNCPTSQEVLCF